MCHFDEQSEEKSLTLVNKGFLTSINRDSKWQFLVYLIYCIIIRHL